MSNVTRMPRLPLVRGECEGEPEKLCPVLRCKYHLVHDNREARRLLLMLDREMGSIEPDAGRVDVWLGELCDLLETTGGSWCALDHADASPDGMEMERVGELLGVSRQRVEQQQRASEKWLKDVSTAGRHKAYREHARG